MIKRVNLISKVKSQSLRSWCWKIPVANVCKDVPRRTGTGGLQAVTPPAWARGGISDLPPWERHTGSQTLRPRRPQQGLSYDTAGECPIGISWEPHVQL